MTTLLKVRYLATLVATALTVLVFAGCSPSPPKGATIVISGPANDTVQWTALQSGNPAQCSCLAGNFTGACANGGVVTLPAGTNGQAQSPPISPVVDDSAVVAFSNAGPTSCMGPPINIPECPNPTSPFTVPCNALNPSGAAGQVTVSGSEEIICFSHQGISQGACPSGFPGTTICDTGTVSVTINGQTVSTQLSCTSTRSSVAFQLAQAIDQNATLGSQFISAPNGPISSVHALNSGTQYNYPWTSSASCSNRAAQWYGQCSFSAGLSPATSLAGGQ